MSFADVVYWIKTIDKEFNFFVINNIWKLVKRPKGKRDILKRCWIFRIKQNLDRDIVRYKA